MVQIRRYEHDDSKGRDCKVESSKTAIPSSALVAKDMTVRCFRFGSAMMA